MTDNRSKARPDRQSAPARMSPLCLSEDQRNELLNWLRDPRGQPTYVVRNHIRIYFGVKLSTEVVRRDLGWLQRAGMVERIPNRSYVRQIFWRAK